MEELVVRKLFAYCRLDDYLEKVIASTQESGDQGQMEHILTKFIVLWETERLPTDLRSSLHVNEPRIKCNSLCL